jgi:hypothetical protein
MKKNLEKDLFGWTQSKIKIKEFSNLTHTIERGLYPILIFNSIS